MSRGFQGAVLRGLGAKDHVLTVTSTEWRTSTMVRVHFHSDTILSPDGEAPAAWMRAWFPDPDGGSKQFQRGYTFAAADPAASTLAVDFVIHHPMGPASWWAQNCIAGDTLVATRFGEQDFELLDPAPRGYLLLGDLASYPAITQIAAAVPADVPVVVYLEKHHDSDTEAPLPQGPNITAAWVDELPEGRALAQAIDGGDWDGWYAWVTGEVTATRHARTVLQREHNLNKATLHAQGYWAAGRAMGKSRVLEEMEAERAEAERTEAEHAEESQQAEPSELPDPTPSAGVLAPARTPMIIAGVIQALLSVLGIVPFILFAELCRQFLDGAGRDQMLSTGVAALVVMGVSALGTTLLMLAMHFYDATYSAALRRRLMDKLARLPLGWFTHRQSSEVRKLVADDVAGMHYIVTHAVPDLVGAVVTPLAALVYLFTVDWRLGLVLLLPIAAFITVMVTIQRKERDRVVIAQRNISTVTGQAQSFIAQREVSQVFGDSSVVDLPGTLRGVGSFVDKLQKDTGAAKIMAVMINRPTTVLGLLVVATWLLMLPGWVSVADAIPFLVLGPSFGAQLVAITGGIGGLLVSLDGRAGLDLALTTPELPGPADRRAPAGHVVLDRVRFGYTPDRDVLTDFSLALEPGTVTAVVGPSGAGKSTVGALLARLWDPLDGSVSIDGTDVRDLTQDELYAKVTILLQDVQLIHTSIRDNIALTAPDATDEQVIAAAEAANIHDTITALPEGYDTVVDSDRLSGGERQRIGIARALLADTPVIVLDEATASADPDSEWAILTALDRLLAGKTVLMIAHRLHAIADADRIVVMDHGRVVEAGRHEQLLADGGAYAALWDAHENAGNLTGLTGKESR